MKKVFLVFVFIVTLMIATTSSTYADTELTIEAEGPEYAAPSATFEMTVSMKNAEDIVGFQMKLHYDETQFECTEIVASDDIEESELQWNPTIDDGTIIVNYVDIDDTLDDEVDLFTLTFLAAEELDEGPQPVIWESAEYNNEFVSYDGEIDKLYPEFAVDAVEVTRGLLGDVNLDGEVTIADAAMIQLHILEMISLTPTEEQLADFDEDGDVSAADIVAMRTSLLND